MCILQWNAQSITAHGDEFQKSCLKYSGCYRLPYTLSIFSAELVTIFLVLLWVSNVEPREVCIISDSLSALKVLHQFKPDDGFGY